MRSKTLLFIFLLLLAWWSRTYAQEGGDPEFEPLILSAEKSEYPLGLHLELLEDPGGELTIDDVSSPEYEVRFTPSTEVEPNFGFTDSAYWVRLRLRSESSSMDSWLLVVNFENMHFVDLYRPSANGDGFEVIQTGTMRPPSTREIPFPRLVFELTPPIQSAQTYYLRFENGAPMILSLTLWQPAAFFTESLRLRLPEILFYGIMIGLLIYNIFLSASLRNVNYLYLAVLLASAVLFELSQTSLLEIYLVPDLYQYKTQIIGLSSAAIMASLILFFDSFLAARIITPNLHRLNLLLMGFVVLLGLASFAFNYHQVAVVLAPTIVVICVLNMLIVAVAWRRGFQAARFLLLAMMGLLACILVFISARLNIIPVSSLTEQAFRLGFVWMAIGSSLALADRINLLKAEAESANRDLQDSEYRLAQTLEAMPVGVVVYGPDQRPTYINERTAAILTNPQRELGPHPELDRTLAEAMDYYAFRRSDSQEAYPLEAFPVYQALQGDPAHADDVEADLVDWRVPLEVWASPVFDENGAVETAVVAFQDITERKQAETALRASERRFRAVVDNNFDGIAFLDRDRKILYVSPSYKRLNGLDAEEMVGKSGVDTIHPDDRSHVAAAFQELLEQPGASVGAEYRIRHQDGSWVWVETRVMNLLDDPHVQAVVLNSRDITERKTTEVELTTYRQHLERLVEERTRELEAINEHLTDEMAERAVLEGLLHKRIQWMSTMALARQRIKGTADLPPAYEQLSQEIARLLDGGSLFLARWQAGETPVEIYCCAMQQGIEPDAVAVRTSFEDGTALRDALKHGEIVLLSGEEVRAMPEAISSCFSRTKMETLLLAPMETGDTISGVLGVALSLPKKNLTEAQQELIRKITYDLSSLAQEARYLDQTRVLVATEERNRLARDLHDSVTQVLFTASLVAEVLPKIWRRDPEQAMESLEELRRLTRGALAEMRTMLLELRPAAVVKSPLAELLAQLTEASASRVELPFRLFIEKAPTLPDEVHAAVYRIAQEALNNVAKHAQASQVTLSLRSLPLTPQQRAEKMVGVRLVVEDDGVGFSPEDKRFEHLGLGIMRERAADVGAELDIKSRIGEGTRVTLDWCGVVDYGENEL